MTKARKTEAMRAYVKRLNRIHRLAALKLWRATSRKTAQLGELVAAAFDSAAPYSSDPRELSRLATQAVTGMLRRAARATASPQLVPA
ncbi:MAG: hypothetical protein ACYC8T_29465 [Myxococcaceae bacterium]